LNCSKIICPSGENNYSSVGATTWSLKVE
jgi:hypothetical protein